MRFLPSIATAVIAAMFMLGNPDATAQQIGGVYCTPGQSPTQTVAAPPGRSKPRISHQTRHHSAVVATVRKSAAADQARLKADMKGFVERFKQYASTEWQHLRVFARDLEVVLGGWTAHLMQNAQQQLQSDADSLNQWLQEKRQSE